jgi:hypothetical protein
MHNEKFIASFIEFINNKFIPSDHMFIILGGKDSVSCPIPKYTNVKILEKNLCEVSNDYKLAEILDFYFEKAEQILLHGLFEKYYINYLYNHNKFLNKCIWAMWGGDLYDYQKRGLISRNFLTLFKKKYIIKRLGGFATYIKGDYDLVEKWHGTHGKYHECFMYPSNLYKDYTIKEKKHRTINIQIGNSADMTNNHIEVFEKLEKFKNDNIKIIVPLSYGNKEYADRVISEGRKIFGNKFEPLTDFMPFDQYLDLLSEIDIAIFNHNRQQAMGNIITLLGLGKKVYIKREITPWKTFENIGVKVYDINNITIDKIDDEIIELNRYKIKEHFSEKNYLKQLHDLFGS